MHWKLFSPRMCSWSTPQHGVITCMNLQHVLSNATALSITSYQKWLATNKCRSVCCVSEASFLIEHPDREIPMKNDIALPNTEQCWPWLRQCMLCQLWKKRLITCQCCIFSRTSSLVRRLQQPAKCTLGACFILLLQLSPLFPNNKSQSKRADSMK